MHRRVVNAASAADGGDHACAVHRRIYHRVLSAAAHLEEAVGHHAINKHGRLDFERPQEEDATQRCRSRQRSARNLEIACTREDDTALHNVVANESMQLARHRRAGDTGYVPSEEGKRRCRKGWAGLCHGKASSW